MIKKMREDNAKKNAPMASDEERTTEAPGLRVGQTAWKWPLIWPYDSDMFKVKEDIEAVQSQSPVSTMSMLLNNGMPEVPEVEEEVEDKNKFNALAYWGEEKAGVTTDLDENTIENLRNHYGFYLRDGMAVLEFGAAENSYLPKDLKLSSHVGVSASKTLMENNPDLTDSIVVDLNNVIEESVIDSEDVRKLGANSFDAIIMSNTIDFLTSPREVYRSAWTLLKPGGIMMVSFSTKDAYVDKFERAQTKMWRDMNDDQHMWIAGSFFQFSAGEGWEFLKGFDISPEGSRMEDKKGPLDGIFNKKKPNSMFVVQATKAYEDDSIDEKDPEKSFKSKMWMMPVLESRDKSLVAPRLARAFFEAPVEEKQLMGDELDKTLPKVYESLVKMDQFAFTFNMQAQLATDLVSDPSFNANDDQIIALKMGLGLRTPSEEFWVPVGTLTANMDAEDKVNLLAHIVPRCGSGNPEQEAALISFVSGLEPTFSAIRSKCPGMSAGDVELLGSELLAAEVLKPGRSTREEFALWLGALTEEEQKSYLEKRKSFKITATEELKEFQAARKAEEERIEAKRKEMRDQVMKAREERSMAFNPETGKMEAINK